MSFPIVIEDNVCSLKKGTQRINLEKRAGAGRLGQALPPGVEGGARGRNRMGKHVNPDGIQSWKILRSVEQDRLGLKSVIREEKASTQ